MLNEMYEITYFWVIIKYTYLEISCLDSGVERVFLGNIDKVISEVHACYFVSFARYFILFKDWLNISSESYTNLAKNIRAYN